MSVRIGVDIGGTFTDFVFHDSSRNLTCTGKRLSTPEAPARAILEGVQRILEETNTPAAAIDAIIHGTTKVTNAVLERDGARIALLATEGFRDVLEMGREIRYDVDDLFLEPVPVLVPRDMRFGVAGRILANGSEHQPLDEAAVANIARAMVEGKGVEAVAIAFLHSYVNPAHERRAREIIVSRYPDLPVSLSSEVAPEMREYERANTACVNAYVQPMMRGYLRKLREELDNIGFAGELSIMLSGGGVTTVAEAESFPVRLIESGPAAGAAAAAYIARQAGEPRVIAFDLGGTTAKMCIIDNGVPAIKHEFEAGRIHRFKAGSGLPLKVTVVDLIEIGAGGGSIAAIDALGLLKVGPRSAGSMPGPVCYGRGGVDPTVTDADLLLGYLNPDFFLGGEMTLSLDAVRAAMEDRLAATLGIDSVAAASGVRAIVDENMAAATRMHLAEQGRDPRAYTLFCSGGAGPSHAYSLAKLLKVSRIIVPLGAGVISALGFLVAPPSVNDVRGYVSALERIDFDRVNQLFAEMEVRALTLLTGNGAAVSDVTITRTADMRYTGQAFDVTVKLPQEALQTRDPKRWHAAFDDTYRALFDRTVDAPLEIVNLRIVASLPSQDISLARVATGTAPQRGSRRVHLQTIGWVDAAVYDRYALAPGARIAGPALFEERESTFACGPDATVAVDRFNNLVVDIAS
jgi:N-methylhydantoinase A